MAEIVALDESGGPTPNALQNGSATAQLCYYVFDVCSCRREIHLVNPCLDQDLARRNLQFRGKRRPSSVMFAARNTV
jgi:hypothetical protein